MTRRATWRTLPNDVLFFTRPDCASCDVLLQRLLKRIDSVAGVDIYLPWLPGRRHRREDWANDSDRAGLGAKPSGHPSITMAVPCPN